jgi:hypothetical protein
LLTTRKNITPAPMREVILNLVFGEDIPSSITSVPRTDSKRS